MLLPLNRDFSAPQCFLTKIKMPSARLQQNKGMADDRCRSQNALC